MNSPLLRRGHANFLALEVGEAGQLVTGIGDLERVEILTEDDEAFFAERGFQIGIDDRRGLGVFLAAADQHRQAQNAADRNVAEEIAVVAHLHDVVADGLRDGGGVDRQRAPEMQADFQLAAGLLLDLLDDDVHSLDGGDRGNGIVDVEVPVLRRSRAGRCLARDGQRNGEQRGKPFPGASMRAHQSLPVTPCCFPASFCAVSFAKGGGRGKGQIREIHACI